jgi:hypothetical protein
MYSRAGCLIANETSNQFRVRVNVDEDFINAETLANLQPDLEYRSTTDRKQTLGHCIGKGPHARSVTTREKKSFQASLTLVGLLTPLCRTTRARKPNGNQRYDHHR